MSGLRPIPSRSLTCTTGAQQPMSGSPRHEVEDQASSSWSSLNDHGSGALRPTMLLRERCPPYARGIPPSGAPLRDTVVHLPLFYHTGSPWSGHGSGLPFTPALKNGVPWERFYGAETASGSPRASDRCDQG